MRQKITVLGSFVVDLMARTPHLPAAGETVRGSRFKQGAGGKGFNQGVAAHKAGGNVSMVTKLGRDALGQVALEAMDAVGMKKDFLFYSEEVETGVALILVDEHASQNEIVVVPGACATLSDDDLAAVEDEIKNSAYLVLQLEINQDANEKAARIAKENGVKVILNTAPYQPVSDEFLNGLFLVTPNEVEAEEMTGVKVDSLEAADRAAAVFFKKGVQNVLITLGGRGVYVNTDGASEILPAYRVDAVDTTAAGDTFTGYFLAAYLSGNTPQDSMRRGAKAASLAIGKQGAAASIPLKQDVDAAL